MNVTSVTTSTPQRLTDAQLRRACQRDIETTLNVRGCRTNLLDLENQVRRNTGCRHLIDRIKGEIAAFDIGIP